MRFGKVIRIRLMFRVRRIGGAKKSLDALLKPVMRGGGLRDIEDNAKLKWWYKLATMPQDRYPNSYSVRSGM